MPGAEAQHMQGVLRGLHPCFVAGEHKYVRRSSTAIADAASAAPDAVLPDKAPAQ
jgi:hypothetical protein